jgi:hypothetical protein
VPIAPDKLFNAIQPGLGFCFQLTQTAAAALS